VIDDHSPTYAIPPGYNGYLELCELERASISPRRILDAATRANAQQFGLAGHGTIEPIRVAICSASTPTFDASGAGGTRPPGVA
jgi:hypothetical protein